MANQAALNLLALDSEEQIIGTNVNQWILCNNFSVYKMDQPFPRHLNQTWFINSGEYVKMEVTLLPLPFDEEAQLTQVFIKESDQIKLQLDKYKLIADHTTDMVSILDLQGRIVYSSPTYDKVTGYSSTDHIGYSPFDFVHPEERDEIHTKFIELIQNQETTTVEFRYKKSEGDYIWLETYGIPVVDEGTVLNVIVVSRDVTVRREAEERLKRNEYKQRMILDHISDLISVVNSEGIYEYVSPSYKKILGYEPNSILGKSIYTCINSEDQQLMKETIEVLKKNKKSPPVRYRKMDVKGRIILLEGIGMPILNDKGEMDQFVIISRDMTEKVKAEQAKINEEKLFVLGELVAGIAHEVRNPLTTIKGFLQLITPHDDGEFLEYAKITMEEINRIEQVVSRFMILAKPFSEFRENINIKRLIEESIQLLKRQGILNKNRTKVIVEMDQPAYLACDPILIKEALVNILENAIEAEATKITISVKEENQQLKMIVTDNGLGVEEARLKTLGEPFYSNKERGIGLGLTISNRIITNHYGKMDFHSKVGEGTAVSIALPLKIEI
ncbi:two-component system sporulation sensor kinase A [Oikeobacillus pervagus]|uniref:histidine kinase n=1 Tax=Oikeobacillus pervagus TaxID=1325931 RepID=A0AAJ1SYU1_9BACI|nr:PAS domain-containing sensor histidine kinase [Oikeobacillus pervagus]MDQ0215344.1 two-component system sporulation sensor kinase A [Oikeobacillus pervagus]